LRLRAMRRGELNQPAGLRREEKQTRSVAPAGRSLERSRVAKFARAGLVESRVDSEAGPAANNLGPRAVLRRHALRAARQRTLEAHGIDCGAGPVSAVRPPRVAVRRATGACGHSLRPNDERDAREVNGNGVVREDLGERPGGQSRGSDGVSISRCAESEADGELVGSDGARAVPVVPAAEVAV